MMGAPLGGTPSPDPFCPLESTWSLVCSLFVFRQSVNPPQHDDNANLLSSTFLLPFPLFKSVFILFHYICTVGQVLLLR